MSRKARVAELRQWAKHVEEEIQKLSSEMGPLREQLGAAEERLDLIHRLMKLEEKGGRGTGADPADTDGRLASKKAGGGGAGAAGATGFEAHIVRILEDAGEPMHVREIRRSLVDSGIPMPGRGEEANIIVRLRRDPDRFTRTGRGTYGLTVWGLEEVKPTRFRKSRKGTVAKGSR